MIRSLVLLPVVLLNACATAGGLPEHPDQLRFEDRELSFPDAAQYRHVLSSGDVVYVVEDHSLPLVRMTLNSRAGSYLLTAEQAGRATLTGSLLRDGGTAKLTPEEVDERLDFLSTGIGFSIGQTSSQASVDTLAGNLEESLDLFFDLLATPRMDAERLAVNRDRVIEQMRRRNDDTRGIEPRVWAELLYGEDFFVNTRATLSSIEAIDGDDLKRFAARVFARGQLVIAVSGAVDTATILQDLEGRLARLPAAEPLPPIPDDPHPESPGLYGVDKPEVNQSRVSLGHPGPMIGDPDEYAIAVMNEILGGGGFTSRITSRVRSDEGLAYSAGSSYGLGRHYPGQFRASFQSRNETVGQALTIVLEEIERIRSEPVTEDELALAIESQIAFLADLYSSAPRMASRFAADEINGDDPGYWRNYEANVRKVTREDVLRVAQAHLQPEQLRILVVGAVVEMAPGLTRALNAPLIQLPLDDPLTLEPQGTRTVIPAAESRGSP